MLQVEVEVVCLVLLLVVIQVVGILEVHVSCVPLQGSAHIVVSYKRCQLIKLGDIEGKDDTG